MTDITVVNSVKEKTTKCERDFKCLTGDTSCLCEVDSSKIVAFIRVKPKAGLSCPYHFPFNKVHFCRCPTRKEIYKKYKK